MKNTKNQTKSTARIFSVILSAVTLLCAISLHTYAVDVIWGDSSTVLEEESPVFGKISVIPAKEELYAEVGRLYFIPLDIDAQSGYKNKTVQINVYTAENIAGDDEILEIEKTFFDDTQEYTLIITPILSGETGIYIEAVDPETDYLYDMQVIDVTAEYAEDSPIWQKVRFLPKTDLVELSVGETYTFEYEIENPENYDYDDIWLDFEDADLDVIEIDYEGDFLDITITGLTPGETQINFYLIDANSHFSFDICTVIVDVTEEERDIFGKLYIDIDTDDVYIKEGYGAWLPFEVFSEEGWEDSLFDIEIISEDENIVYADYAQSGEDKFVNIETVSTGETDVCLSISDPESGEYYDSVSVHIIVERMTLFEKIVEFFKNIFNMLFGWLS